MASVSANSAIAEPRLNAIIKRISEEEMKWPVLRTMPSQKRKRFTIDLALIGLSIRTGYLVDVITPQNAVEVFGQLISGLRLTCPEFQTVAHVYEPNADQSFFVNTSMLLNQRKLDHQGYTPGVSFVHLGIDVPYSLVSNPPSAVTDALLSLIDDATTQPSLPPSITIRTRLLPETAIALAAVLLEYPVAYVPASLKHPFLCNVPLDVYECVLTFEQHAPHSLLKFSCPSELAKNHPDVLAPSRIVASLTKNFRTRVQRVASGTLFEMLHTSQTLNSVAL